MQINRILNSYKIHNISIEIKNNIPSEYEYSCMLSNFFSKLTQLQTYPNVDVFNNYNVHELLVYLKFIFKFNIIDDLLDDTEKDRLCDFYSKCDDDNTQENISEFKYYTIYILNKIVNNNNENKDTIALIITEAMMSTIIQAYSDREFEHIAIYLTPESSSDDSQSDNDLQNDNNDLQNDNNEVANLDLVNISTPPPPPPPPLSQLPDIPFINLDTIVNLDITNDGGDLVDNLESMNSDS